MTLAGTPVTGYAHRDYAASLGEFGAPRELPASKGWVLVSAVGDTGLQDARGCYPIFACSDWRALGEDLDTLGGDLVSLVIVTDPFHGLSEFELQRQFPDLCRPYKEHFVVDLEIPFASVMSRNHARYARRAAELVSVELCPEPLACWREWTQLYENLIARHSISGISAFSAESFRRQLQVPGIVAFRAVREGATVGMILYYIQGEVAYYHLAAYTEAGYETRASYALFAQSLAYFTGKQRWVSLGAGAGVHGNAEDGLSRFKRGWSTGTRTAHICGRVFDRERYDTLTSARKVRNDDFFPLYRKGER